MRLTISDFQWKGKDCVIEVEFDYILPSRGHRDKYGCPEEPDEPEDVDINAVGLVGKTTVDIVDDLTNTELNLLREKLLNHLAESRQDADDDYPEPE